MDYMKFYTLMWVFMAILGFFFGMFFLSFDLTTQVTSTIVYFGLIAVLSVSGLSRKAKMKKRK